MITAIDFQNIMVASTSDSTLSRLWVAEHDALTTRPRGLCWILEDGPRGVKVPKETRIPAGRFRLKPTRDSKFYQQYRNDPALKLKYILTLEDVPDFSLIRVHPGVDVGDTAGCQLPGIGTGMDANSNFTVARSKEALKRIHKILDPYFIEKKMDFSIPVYWETIRIPLIDLVKAYPK